MNKSLLYDNEELKKLDSVLQNKVSSVEDFTKNNISPTLDERKKMLFIVEDYIKKNKLKLYGGHAHNLTISNRSMSRRIYKDPDDLHDYDVYSMDPVNDGIKICNILFNIGFNNVILKEAIHVATYSISYNQYVLCDLTYVPKKIFNTIPFNIYEGFIVCQPSFFIIDFLRIFIDPVNSNFRWRKQLKRFELIQDIFPLSLIDKPALINEEDIYEKIKPDYKKTIKKYLKDNEDCLITGFYLYNKYISLTFGKPNKSTFKKFKNPVFEIICTKNYKNNVINFMKNLTIAYPESKISCAEKYPFFQFTDYSALIFIDNLHVATIYKNNNICIPYVMINKFKFVSFHYLLLWFFVQSFYERVYNKVYDEDKKFQKGGDIPQPKVFRLDKNNKKINIKENEYRKLASHIIYFKNTYLKKNKLSILDKSIFENFIINCKGDILPPIEIKKSYNVYRNFIYEPSVNYLDSYKFSYFNLSGGFIYKPEDEKLKID